MTTGQVIKTYRLNPSHPIEIAKFRSPLRRELVSQPNMKYADYNKAMEVSTNYVARLLAMVPAPKYYKRILVDVKVTDMKKGQLPCLPRWHLDCTMHPNREETPETHFLFVTGAGCRTKFVTSPVDIMINPEGRLVDIDWAVKHQEPDIYKIKEGVLTRYNRYNLHAPSVAESDGQRLLVRVTCCDFIRPNPIR